GVVRARRVNPGRHVLEVSAPGKQSHRRAFDVGAGQHIAIDVPPLEPERAPTVLPAAAPEADRVASARPPRPGAVVAEAPRAEASAYGAWPWVLTGTGAALLGAG